MDSDRLLARRAVQGVKFTYARENPLKNDELPRKRHAELVFRNVFPNIAQSRHSAEIQAFSSTSALSRRAILRIGMFWS